MDLGPYRAALKSRDLRSVQDRNLTTKPALNVPQRMLTTTHLVALCEKAAVLHEAAPPHLFGRVYAYGSCVQMQQGLVHVAVHAHSRHRRSALVVREQVSTKEEPKQYNIHTSQYRNAYTRTRSMLQRTPPLTYARHSIVAWHP